MLNLEGTIIMLEIVQYVAGVEVAVMWMAANVEEDWGKPRSAKLQYIPRPRSTHDHTTVWLKCY